MRCAYLPDAALPLERFERGGNVTSGKLLDGRFQSRVFLADNLVELGRAHPGFLQLLEWTASLDALMLANVADEQYPVLRSEPCEEIPHLVGACQTRLINKVEMPLGWRIGIYGARKELLQRIGDDACVIELARGARGRGKTAHGVAFRFCCAADRR